MNLPKTKDLLKTMLQKLVDNPEKITVDTIPFHNGMMFEIDGEKTDKGKLVGKNGRTVAAVRTLCVAYCAREGLKCQILIK